MTKGTYRVLLTAMIIWVVFHNIWAICGNDLFYYGTAYMIFSAAFCLRMTVKGRGIGLCRFFLIIASSNLSDELFGNPSSFGCNEYVFAILILIYYSTKGLKHRRRHRTLNSL